MGSQSSVEVWRGRVIAQARSGESKSTFCERRGLALSTFHRWCRRFAEADEGAQPSFVEVFESAAPQLAAADMVAEIHLPSGPVVRCPVGSDVAWLRDLASALSPC